jgi:hypothetical protein
MAGLVIFQSHLFLNPVRKSAEFAANLESFWMARHCSIMAFSRQAECAAIWEFFAALLICPDVNLSILVFSHQESSFSRLTPITTEFSRYVLHAGTSKNANFFCAGGVRTKHPESTTAICTAD